MFFYVDPRYLHRIESGYYVIAFEKHQHKCEVVMEVFEKWKKTLNEVLHISNLPFKKNES